MSTIFLSYAGADRQTATRLKAGLAAAGADIWQDVEQIQLGDRWIDTLQDALTRCSAYVILIGSGGIQRWVKLELSIALKRHFDTNGGFPIFPLRLPGVTPEDLPPFLSIFQAEALCPDPGEGDYRRLAERLAAASDQGAAIPLSPVCPYPGLESYTEATAEFFFGRQSETLEVLARLGSTRDGTYRRWLQIEGPSGVGKSSLVLAGMVPAMRRGWIESRGGSEPRNWAVALMRPGHEPLLNLSHSLMQALPAANGLGVMRQALAAAPEALRDLCRERAPPGQRFLLVVDQLEEIFTLTEAKQRREQFDALLAAALADRDGVFHLVTTIRSDFTLRLGELPTLQTLLNTAAERYYLPPIGRTGLRDVVTTPTRRAGLGWDEAGLPERIVEEAAREANALPLVSNLLSLLWQRRRERGDALLRDADYRALGGVGGALADSADRLLASLGKDGTERARKLLLRLVKVSRDSPATRRTISRAQAVQAAGGGEAGERILARLSGGAGQDSALDPAGPRLVMVWNPKGPAGTAADDRVDLAHETLLTRWATLHGWVAEHRGQLEAEEALEEVAEHWQQAGKPRFPGLPAAAMRKRYRRAEAPSPLAQDYLRAVGQQRAVRFLVFSLGVGLLAAFGIFFAWIGAEGYPLRTGVYGLLARSGVYTLQPEMVPITGGTFPMGSPVSEKGRSDDERPHAVPVGDFGIGRYEVTFDEYDVFALATGRTKASDQSWGRGRRPVINVDWNDAVAYAEWLSKQTGTHYRLPTEAEWEYAARGGTTTAYWWGETFDDQKANNDRSRTTPVGDYPSNPFGLYDVLGNVWEWTGSRYDASYDGSETRLAGREDDGAGVVRGGSWSNAPGSLRSAKRFRLYPDSRSYAIGFRLAQD